MPEKENLRTQSPTIRYLQERYIGDDASRLAAIQEERDNLDIAQQVLQLRESANLTVAELADRVCTEPSIIEALEDADYEGDSLSMLRRIAAALGQRVQLRFVPLATQGMSTAAT